jgi:hypothetical protein
MACMVWWAGVASSSEGDMACMLWWAGVAGSSEGDMACMLWWARVGCAPGWWAWFERAGGGMPRFGGFLRPAVAVVRPAGGCACGGMAWKGAR